MFIVTAGRRQQPVTRPKRLEVTDEFLGCPYRSNHDVQFQEAGDFLSLAGSLGGREIICVIDDPDATHGRKHRLEDLQPLGREFCGQTRYPGDVTAGTRHGGHEAGCDRISNLGEDNGNRSRGVFDGTSRLLRLRE